MKQKKKFCFPAESVTDEEGKSWIIVRCSAEAAVGSTALPVLKAPVPVWIGENVTDLENVYLKSLHVSF